MLCLSRASISCVYLWCVCLSPVCVCPVSFVYFLRLSPVSNLVRLVSCVPPNASISCISSRVVVLCCLVSCCVLFCSVLSCLVLCLVRLYFVSYAVRLSPVLSCIILPCLFCSASFASRLFSPYIPLVEFLISFCVHFMRLCCVLFCFLCVPSVSSIYPPGGILNILLCSVSCLLFPLRCLASRLSPVLSCIILPCLFCSASFASRLFSPYIPLVEFFPSSAFYLVLCFPFDVLRPVLFLFGASVLSCVLPLPFFPFCLVSVLFCSVLCLPYIPLAEFLYISCVLFCVV